MYSSWGIFLNRYTPIGPNSMLAQSKSSHEILAVLMDTCLMAAKSINYMLREHGACRHFQTLSKKAIWASTPAFEWLPKWLSEGGQYNAWDERELLLYSFHILIKEKRVLFIFSYFSLFILSERTFLVLFLFMKKQIVILWDLFTRITSIEQE